VSSHRSLSGDGDALLSTAAPGGRPGRRKRMNRRVHKTVRRLGLTFVVALAAAVVVPAALAVDLNKLDESSAALARSQTPTTDKYFYADGVLRRTDGTPLSSPVIEPPDKYVYSDGVLRRTDGTPLSSPVFEPSGTDSAASGIDWSDAWLGALAGSTAALLLAGAAFVAIRARRHGRMATA
jgi:hypothetical protein